MPRHLLTLTPRDLLFFRDARPMDGAAVGGGARWPLPSVLHGAILSAFRTRWPELDPEFEGRHVHATAKEQKRAIRNKSMERSSLRFGGLQVAGPFPHDGTHLYLPTPADLVVGGIQRPVAAPAGASTNLPAPWLRPVAADVPPTKESPEPWISLAEFRRYLAGEANVATTPASTLYATETRPGVGIDAATHANREHVFYQAEYLRLAKGVRLMAAVQAEAKKRRDAVEVKDLIADFKATGMDLLLGGQGGVACADIATASGSFPDIPPPDPSATRLKWVLLTPACFAHGWRPGWLDEETGEILLRPDKITPIHGRLVAARIAKPLAVSGWRLDKDADHAGGGPKATQLLVPGGSVYHFEFNDAASAVRFAAALHLRCRSDMLGEKGFGLGVCSSLPDPPTPDLKSEI